MATIDSQIALAARGPQIDNPMDVYGKALNLRDASNRNQVNQMAIDKATRDIEQERTLADLYRGAVLPDGTIDRQKIYSGAAQAGLGARVPGMQENFLKIDRAAADLKKVGADTTKTEVDTSNVRGQIDERDMKVMQEGLKYIDGAIASMAADPNITDVKVAAEMGRLVRLGAFNTQAKQAKVTPDEAARQVMSTMPVGNPQALRQWLIQAGMRTADASKRLELMLPKYDEQDRGGTLNQGTIDLTTGIRTPVTDITKTNTPGEVLSADTTYSIAELNDARARSTAALVDSRMREANKTAQAGVDAQKEAQRTQVVETPDGFVLVDKGLRTSTPVMDAAGNRLLPKDSKLAEDRKMAADMAELIAEGRRLLKSGSGPTGSPVGAVADKIMSVTGLSTQGMDLAGQLETLGGWMTSNVPRMQGPQGVQDVILYKQMAAQVGDRTVPIDTRLKALDTLETIMRRQGKYTGGTPTTPSPAAANRPMTPTLPPLDSFYTTPKK